MMCNGYPWCVNIAALTHYDVINLMTKGGTIKGIFEDGGELYINATYIMTGSCRMRKGEITGIWRRANSDWQQVQPSEGRR